MCRDAAVGSCSFWGSCSSICSSISGPWLAIAESRTWVTLWHLHQQSLLVQTTLWSFLRALGQTQLKLLGVCVCVSCVGTKQYVYTVGICGVLPN